VRRSGTASPYGVVMTEDVLEQVVDDWLRRSGYFTRTNVRFGPVVGDEGYSSRAHNQRSDLDVLAVKPTETGPARVWAVSCKAMQAGFSPNRWLEAADADRTYNGKLASKHLRELWDPVWAEALRRRVHELTGSEQFTYVLAVTRVGQGGNTDVDCWLQHPIVSNNLAGNPCKVLTFGRMWSELRQDVKEQIEPSHVGRLAQLLKAAELDGPIYG
jgi:hypothetical protein